MSRTTVVWALIAANILGFLICRLDIALSRGSGRRKLEPLVLALALLGGSPCVALCMLLFDKKWVKENMMTKVALVCIVALQAAALLFIFARPSGSGIHLVRFFRKYRFLLWVLPIVNLAAFALFGIDKRNAIRRRRRVPITTLLAFAFAGGSIGAWAGMVFFRHKTQKNYFAVGVPLILAMQVVLLLCLSTFC